MGWTVVQSVIYLFVRALTIKDGAEEDHYSENQLMNNGCVCRAELASSGPLNKHQEYENELRQVD